MVTTPYLVVVSLLASLAAGSAINPILAVRVGAGNTNYVADARAQNSQRKICHMWRQNFKLADGSTQARPIRRDDTVAECAKQCPAGTKGFTCALTTTSTPQWLSDPSAGQGVQYTMAPCLCDDKTVAVFVDAFIEGLPAIGQVICTVWVGALTGLVDALINSVLDTAEQAVKAVESMGSFTSTHGQVVQGALQFKSAVPDMSQARSAFGKWVASKVCNFGVLSKGQSDQIFDAVSQVNNLAISAASLPLGGGALAGFRLTSIPKLAGNAESVLSQLTSWKDPPVNPKNGIPNPKHIDGPKAQQASTTLVTKTTTKAKRAEHTVMMEVDETM